MRYCDTDMLSKYFPMSKSTITSLIKDGNRHFTVYHINSKYGIMSKIPVRDGEANGHDESSEGGDNL